MSVAPVLDRHPEYRRARILERLAEPERVIIFRTNWVDDAGEVQLNRGFRVQMNSAIGPYKGGLRFHPTVDLDVLKFLAFEQVFKNALTTLPMGGAKGGSDFDPKGKSDAEVRRFCQSFMTELYRHIGQFTDVPAGDIGVGGREIGFLFGQYKRITNEFTRGDDGQGPNWVGPSSGPRRPGTARVYFAERDARHPRRRPGGQALPRVGSGNVAQYTAEKLLDLGAKAVTLSDSDGFVVDPAGIDARSSHGSWTSRTRGAGASASTPSTSPGATFTPAQEDDDNPLWDVPADCAFPCATQNEISSKDAANLLSNGIGGGRGRQHADRPRRGGQFLAAGHPLRPGQGGQRRRRRRVGARDGPGQRAGAVARRAGRRASALDRARHPRAGRRAAAEEYGVPGNYVVGANVAGFVKVADAMLDEGTI